jgi:hypothetical protein
MVAAACGPCQDQEGAIYTKVFQGESFREGSRRKLAKYGIL